MPGSSRIFHTTPQDSHDQTSCLVFELFQVFHMVLLFKVIKYFAVTFASVACCPKKRFRNLPLSCVFRMFHLGTNIPMIHSFCQKMLWNNCFVNTSASCSSRVFVHLQNIIIRHVLHPHRLHFKTVRPSSCEDRTCTRAVTS